MMKLCSSDIKFLIDNHIIELSKIPQTKGSQLIFYRGRGLYVWKNDVNLFFKDKHFWNRKYKFKISEITGKEDMERS